MAAIIFNAQYRTFNIAPFNSVFKEALLQKKKIIIMHLSLVAVLGI